MPVTLRLREREFFKEHPLALNVFNHFLNGNVVIADGGRFAVTFEAKMIQFHYKSWLVGFGAAGNSERVNKRQLKFVIAYFQD